MATPMTSPHFDLKNTLNVQQKYAVDLTKMPIDANMNSANDNAIQNLNTQLAQLYNNVSNSQIGSNSVLYKQKIVNDILDKENARLQAKQTNINTAISGQKRIIALNNNYQKRYAAYTKMVIAIVVGLVLYIFIDKLRVLLPFIPEIVFYLIIIVILGSIIFYVYLLWIDIHKREPTNFDELALPAPDLSGAPSAADAAAAANSATPGSGPSGSSGTVDYTNCKGADCCGYDEYGNKIPYSPSTGCATQASTY